MIEQGLIISFELSAYDLIFYFGIIIGISYSILAYISIMLIMGTREVYHLYTNKNFRKKLFKYITALEDLDKDV